MTSLNLGELIELGDPDELIREIDRRCVSRDWDGLVELRDRCNAAVVRGKQLWGVAGHADYRIALEAPVSMAADVVASEPGPFVLGPIPEVLASRHSWVDLSRHMQSGPHRHMTAYECVARGEDLRSDDDASDLIASFELPLMLQAWEPRYAMARYESTRVLFEKPLRKVTEIVDLRPRPGVVVDEPNTGSALAALVGEWSARSNGTVSVAAVEGGAAEALHALGEQPGSVERIRLQDALAWMAWAGAGGGYHGRRNGAASGRAKAWWALASVLGDPECDPSDFDDLVADSDGVSWWTWGVLDADSVDLRLLAVDAEDGVAFGIAAHDETG